MSFTIMTLTIITNAVPCGAVLVVIVGGLAWAIATGHRDHRSPVAASRSRRALPRFDLPSRSARRSAHRNAL
jgi:hypothetical protein